MAVGFKLGVLSKLKMRGVHEDLQRVVRLSAELSTLEFTVVEGLRTTERQMQLVMAGASQTTRSRHITGHAVDLAPLVDSRVRWDWPLFDILAKYVKRASMQLDIPVEWGGDWKTFRDGPHFQLPWKDYP